MIRLTAELLVANATAYAASGEWAGLRELLAQHPKIALQKSELATLRAEAELRTGHPAEALEWLAVVLPFLESNQHRNCLRTALNLRGVAELELGALDDAELTFARVIELARSDGDELLTARVLNNLGALLDMRDHHNEALSHYERAIPSYQRLGSTRGLAETHHNIATTLRHQGQIEAADEHERRAMAYASEARNDTLECLARLGLGEIALEAGDAPLAEAIARHAAWRFVGLGDGLREAEALRVEARACLLQQKIVEARQRLRRALELAVAHGARLLEAELRRLNAELLWRDGERAAAKAEAKEAGRLFEQAGAAARAREATTWNGDAG